MDLVQGVAIIYVLILLIFALGFLVNWYRNRATMAEYQRIGLGAGVVFVLFELATLVLSASSLFLFGFNMCLVIASLGWGALRTWGFVNNGIFFSNQLNIRSFPLIAPRLGLPPAPQAITAATPGVDMPIGSAVVPPQPIDLQLPIESPASVPPEPPPAPPPINWRDYALSTLGVSLGAIAYSAVLFLITHPHPGLIAQGSNLSNTPILTPATLVVLLEFALVEELMFRLGIQNYLGAKLIDKPYGYILAIILTSALWSMAHVGSLNPDWVKLAQIFPLGLALGWLYRRHGTESTIMAHALFNFLGGLLLSPLYLQ